LISEIFTPDSSQWRARAFCIPDRRRDVRNAPPHNLRPRYNVCPTDPVDVVTAERQLIPMRWGLVPRWWSKPLKELRMATFNARAERVETKPVFRDDNRCLIPVSGYFEWQDTPTGKQPWYFTIRDGSPILTAAGLWYEWKDPQTGEPLKSCTMIITEPRLPDIGPGSSLHPARWWCIAQAVD
jgi:putative SOS response-associated peptidase YedK